MALFPISNILKRNKIGYKIEEKKVSNLLYMDDLKVYAKSETEMEKCRALIKELSDDICMKFDLDKCEVIHIKKGKGTHLPGVTDIPLLTKEKFLHKIRSILNKRINRKEHN